MVVTNWGEAPCASKWRFHEEEKNCKNVHYGQRHDAAGRIPGGACLCHRRNVSGAIEGTWTAAQGQIKDIVNNVVFPVIDMILAVLLFVKIATAYTDYRKHGQFEFTAPAILFACLLFSLTAPSYIWNIL